MTSWLSEKMSHRHSPTSSVISSSSFTGDGSYLAMRFFERWLGHWIDSRVALTLSAELTPFLQVAVERHSFLEELLHGRVEAREKR